MEPTTATKEKAKPKKASEIIKNVKLVAYWDEHYYEVTFLDEQKKFIPSVTTYLGALSKDWLPRFRGDVGNREADLRMNEAAERGSRLHYCFTILAKGGVVLFQHHDWQNPDAELKIQNEAVIHQCKLNEIPFFILHSQDEMIQVNRLAQWLEAVNPVVEATDSIIYSLEHNFAGTLDMKINIEGGKYGINGSDLLDLPAGRYIVDFKTGAEDDAHALQVAAYSIATQEMLQESVRGALIVYTNAKTRKGIEGVKTVFVGPEDIKTSFQTFTQVRDLWLYQHPNNEPKVVSFKSIVFRNPQIQEPAKKEA